MAVAAGFDAVWLSKLLESMVVVVVGAEVILLVWFVDKFVPTVLLATVADVIVEDIPSVYVVFCVLEGEELAEFAELGRMVTPLLALLGGLSGGGRGGAAVIDGAEAAAGFGLGLGVGEGTVGVGESGTCV